MKDTDKTKEQLLDEMAKLRQKNAELEASESERKWAEQELRESQKRYQSLTEASPVGIFHSDSQGNYLYVNERWGEIASLSPEEAYGKGWENVLHPDDKKRVLTEWYKGCQEKRPFKSEFRFQPSTGISVWVLCQSSVEKNANGEVVGYIGTITDITYRKQLEETMRESEEKYRELVNTTVDAVISIDQNMRVVLWNPAAEKVFAYSEDEIMGQSLMKIVPERHWKAMEKGFAEFQKSGSGPAIGKSIEIEALGKDGMEFPIELSISSRKVCDTYIATAIARDITERRRAEEELKSSEERMRILFEYAPDGYYLNDFKGNFVDGNRAAEELTGYRRDELIGKNFLKLKLLSPKEIPKAAALLAKNVLGHPTGPDEFILHRKDGTHVVVDIRTFPVKIKGQSLVLGNVRDITKRKQAEEAVRESEEKHRTLVESAKDYIFMIDKDNKVLSLNKAGAFLFRTQPEKIIGKSIFELFPNEIATRYSVNLKKVFKTNKSSSHESKMVVEGKESWLSVSLNPICDHNGKVESVMGVSRDITAQKQAQEKIKRSLEEKEILLKEIHHRVKNNMQIIASLLRIQAADIKDEKIQAIFNGIHDRIRSMAVLYEMLYQSKDMAKVDLSEYIRRLTTHLVSTYRAGLGPTSLKLDVKDVYLDVKRAIPCGLIITELVSNSLKHAFLDGKKAEIAVEMHPDKGKKYTLVVKDDGVGFPEGADFRNTKSLGMKLVVDLVKQINGTIDLSRAKGTEFKIVF